MFLKRKILTSSQIIKMAEIFLGRCFKNGVANHMATLKWESMGARHFVKEAAHRVTL